MAEEQEFEIDVEEQEFKIDDFVKGFRTYVSNMKKENHLLNEHVRKMKRQLRYVGDVSKEKPAKNTEEDYLLRSFHDSGSEMNRNQDGLTISDTEWGKFNKLLKNVFEHHLKRVPMALRISTVAFLCGIVEVPSYLRIRWNINNY